MSPPPVSESSTGPFITSFMKPPQLHHREGLFSTLAPGWILHQTRMVSPAWRSLGLVSTLMRNLWTTGWMGEATQVKQGPYLSQGPGLSEPVNPEPPEGGHDHNVSPSLWLCTPLRFRLWGSTSCNYPSGGGKLGQLEEVWAIRSALAVLSVPNRCSVGGGPASGLSDGQEGRRVWDRVWGCCSEKGSEEALVKG